MSGSDDYDPKSDVNKAMNIIQYAPDSHKLNQLEKFVRENIWTRQFTVADDKMYEYSLSKHILLYVDELFEVNMDILKTRFKTGVYNNVNDFEKDVIKFTQLGGTYIVGPELEAGDYNTWTFNEKFRMAIDPDDFLIPICHEGMNRSQVLALVFAAIKKYQHTDSSSYPTVSLPHGAESGFDPYVDTEWTIETLSDDDTYYKYIQGVMLDKEDRGEWLHRAFFDLFGVTKAYRIGQYHSEKMKYNLNLNDTYVHDDAEYAKVAHDRTEMRKYMSNLLFNVCDVPLRCAKAKGRVVLVCFARAPMITLKRIMQQITHTNPNLNKIVIVDLPWPDTIARAGGQSDVQLDMLKWSRFITTYSEIPTSVKESWRYATSMSHQLHVYLSFASIFMPIRTVEPASGAGSGASLGGIRMLAAAPRRGRSRSRGKSKSHRHKHSKSRSKHHRDKPKGRS